MRHEASIPLLNQHNKVQLARLAYLAEYSQNVSNAQVKQALAQVIDDTQEAIARVASRLRQLGAAPGRVLDEPDEKLLRQSRARRSVADKLKFVRQGLKFQLEWYEARVREVMADDDTQAILVALTEQTRVRLEQWDRLMRDLKVPPE
jgi:hypothetical protein